ncbi:hypothetical protein BU600_08935 [Staphylococcus arlettae]|uniref:Uncharacterized protein n=1 Tax=Staphylococcus arlettae TaxID=29378 RepID=A0A2T7BV90_9STAP|nr:MULTISPECIES: hypothetical protein [Staphylococcus]EJY95294.1 hypothetical protein SARL_08479 [Staphylococcus arlettae CVD059]ERF48941.1 hypothetical protein N039_01315 [Staphylococcus sp. EGD-HP3]KAB2481028.1 hypothetical protein F9B39_01830 [Staphylococcus sp. CH99b_3]MBF0737182.1 hypothetical protein [Staphylococcus arlettae]MBK3718819.1 hypothetical protein [Staphylococcus arlettae]
MNLVIIFVLSLVFAILATLPFLFVNTQLYEHKNQSSADRKTEKRSAVKRFCYHFILAFIMLVIYHFLTD